MGCRTVGAMTVTWAGIERSPRDRHSRGRPRARGRPYRAGSPLNRDWLCRRRAHPHPRAAQAASRGRAELLHRAYAGIAASAQIESQEGCGNDRANIRNKLAEIADPQERAAVEAEAKRMAERIVDSRWLDLSRIALRLEVCRRLSGDDLRELLAPRHRAAA